MQSIEPDFISEGCAFGSYSRHCWYYLDDSKSLDRTFHVGRPRAVCRKIGATALRAIAIHDSQVAKPSPENYAAGVTSRGEVHNVVFPGTPHAVCTCADSTQGNVCEHAMKVSSVT